MYIPICSELFLSRQLLRYPDVRFAGYKIPHPLENILEIKLQTDGKRDPLTAMKDATADMLTELTHLESSFKVVVLTIRECIDNTI